MGYLPTVLRRRLVWILFTLAMLPQKGLTFSPVHNHQSSQPQGMSRRYNGGNTALSAAGSQNSNGRTWTSSDDLTVISSTMADLQDSQSVVSPTSLEIASGKAQPFSQAQRFISALDHPTLQMGRFLVLLASCIYGTNFTVVKLLDDTMPLSVSACLRFGLAASVVSALVLSREPDDVEPKLKKERNLAFWGGVEIGLWYCIGYIAQGTKNWKRIVISGVAIFNIPFKDSYLVYLFLAEGLQTVAAGKSAFFNALAVVVVPILDVMFKSKILKPTEIASVLIACLGVGMLELGPEGGLTISSGDVLAFMQTIFFGIGYWRLESESHTHSDQAARLTIGQLSAVGVGSLFYAFTELGFGHLGISSFEQVIGWFEDPFIVGALLWTGLISTALALVSILCVSGTTTETK